MYFLLLMGELLHFGSLVKFRKEEDEKTEN